MATALTRRTIRSHALLAILFLAPTSPVAAQGVTEVWQASDPEYYTGVMMDIDDAGNVYTLGHTVVGDILRVKKYDPNGVLLWSATYDPPERVTGSWLVVDPAGNVVVSGHPIAGSDADPVGFLTLKYDASGTLLWARSLPNPRGMTARVACDAQGNVYVAGRMWLTNTVGNTTDDFVLVKYDPAGTLLWARSFDDGFYSIDSPASLAISPDGTRISLAGAGGNTLLAVTWDASGNLLWSSARRDILPATDLAYSKSGDLYTAGSAGTTLGIGLVRIDPAGRTVWTTYLPQGYNVYRLTTDAADNAVLAGIAIGGYTNWITAKVDPSGRVLWTRVLDSHLANDEIPGFVTTDASGAVYVTGSTGPGPGSGMLSYMKLGTAKYAPDGAPQWFTATPWSPRGVRAIVDTVSDVTVLGQGSTTVRRYRQTGLTDAVPSAPAALAGSGGYTGTVYAASLSWSDRSDNEFWFTIHRCQGQGCTDFVEVGRTRGENVTSFQDRPLSAGTTYTYQVRAQGFMGPSAFSNAVAVTTPVIEPPAAPTALAASLSGASVVLTWQDNATTEAAFYVERCEGAGCTSFTGLGATYSNITTYTDSGAVAGRSYSYRVRAYGQGMYSEYSNVASIVTPGPPAAPANLAARALTASSIGLTWTNVAAGQTEVQIERCTGSGCTAFSPIAVVGGSAKSFTDAGLAARTVYTYRVRARNALGYSPYSNTASARTRR